jgi:Holliday junction resolvase
VQSSRGSEAEQQLAALLRGAGSSVIQITGGW